ncbi:MAG: hypothetical protein WCF34_01575 [Pseudolabrys sp.]
MQPVEGVFRRDHAGAQRYADRLDFIRVKLGAQDRRPNGQQEQRRNGLRF